MKTIIIPSDFSGESIQVAETVVRDSAEEVRLVFIHLFHVSHDIQDLLFLQEREREYSYVSDQFWEECKMLKDLFGRRLKSIRIDFYYGNKLASFKNFLEHHETTAIAISESYGVPKLNKNSIDAVPVLRKCGYPIVDTDLIHVSALTASGTTFRRPEVNF
ncbi:hypothetical protein [Dyadobacter sandarakinus]|uniref:Nucleotide-binding universal stress protein, UspA family n=1 Tax=Dyadobacter sandarakinus TaxID=2747268 RepID=A0ABX7I186_9BACT|nr:hypothetical protein [Dyadobacter sandarakinus]QRQ99659.1 hypothetical protein HWI92_01380 [Dyadobacter sandarakinus]